MGFAGLDNRTSAHETPGAARDVLPYLSRARNVDIDARNRPKRRPGQTLKVTGACHGLFAAEDICLMVSAGILYRVWPDWTITVLRTGVTNQQMSYAYVNGIVYYTNPSVIGYVEDGLSATFTEPDVDFKRAPFPGQLIEYYNGRLYIAKGPVQWFTDALAFNRVDTRKNFKQYPTDIAMMRAVDGGMYVSDKEKTYFIDGDTPTNSKLKIVAPAAIPGSDIVIKGQDVKKAIQGRVAFFATKSGVYMGTGNGEAINITSEHYNMPTIQKGAAIFQSAADISKLIMRLYN
jgi:hypothetical protein